MNTLLDELSREELYKTIERLQLMLHEARAALYAKARELEEATARAEQASENARYNDTKRREALARAEQAERERDRLSAMLETFEQADARVAELEAALRAVFGAVPVWTDDTERTLLLSRELWERGCRALTTEGEPACTCPVTFHRWTCPKRTTEGGPE